MSESLRRRARQRKLAKFRQWQQGEPLEAQQRAAIAMAAYEQAIRRRDWLKRQQLPATRAQSAKQAYDEAVAQRRSN